MNQNYQWNKMWDQTQAQMPGTTPLLPTPSVGPNLYGPYEGFTKGNLFRDLYQQYKNYQPARLTPRSEQEELLLNVDQLTFAAHELNLYLDVYPEDRMMIDLFNQYRTMANQAIQTYENQYGPITVNSDALTRTPWAWESDVWPWAKEAN